YRLYFYYYLFFYTHPAPTEIYTLSLHTLFRSSARQSNSQGLDYFASRVGGDEAQLLQVGSPFDYERQMKLYVANQMPDPRDGAYRGALIRWIEHFVKKTHGKAIVLFTNSKLMRETAEQMEGFFDKL